jgi:anti-sigma factor RsiW
MDNKNIYDPVLEADLHAYVDNQLDLKRRAIVESYLNENPGKHHLVSEWMAQNEIMRTLLSPVLDESIPSRIPVRAPISHFPWRGLAASIAIAMVSASSAWMMRGKLDGHELALASARTNSMVHATEGNLSGFARRAAVAHVVYSPDVRRPVEVGAEQEQQLVAWLSKRLGTEVRPPSLQTIGYELIGGRLLPGDTGPVAQFMYHDAVGQRLTLYVTREVPKLDGQPETAFRFGKDGPVNVFYWVDKKFGYAISGGADREELMRVSQEVYRQLEKT